MLLPSLFFSTTCGWEEGDFISWTSPLGIIELKFISVAICINLISLCVPLSKIDSMGVGERERERERESNNFWFVSQIQISQIIVFNRPSPSIPDLSSLPPPCDTREKMSILLWTWLPLSSNEKSNMLLTYSSNYTLLSRAYICPCFH